MACPLCKFQYSWQLPKHVNTSRKATGIQSFASMLVLLQPLRRADRRCVASRELLKHHQRCTSSQCPVCTPVKQYVQKQRQVSLSQANAARQQQAHQQQQQAQQKTQARLLLSVPASKLSQSRAHVRATHAFPV